MLFACSGDRPGRAWSRLQPSIASVDGHPAARNHGPELPDAADIIEVQETVETPGREALIMKLFVDSANLDELRKAASYGIVDGVTTNPSLLAKQAADLDPRDVLKEICSLVDGPVSGEVVATDAEQMVREGRELAALADNIVVKIPMLADGLIAVRQLATEGIAVNVTLCFSSMQCLLAAKAGAAYVSPFIGRLDDVSHEGMDVIRESRLIFDNYAYETEILAASIRHPRHVAEAAMIGADVATMPTAVLKKLSQHPLTDRGLEQFLSDWKQLQSSPQVGV